MLAVGCEHTGYKSLMAGLVTEWIYDAFAGKPSYICITFFLTNSMNSPISCWHFSMYFQVLTNGTLLEVLAGHGMVIEDSDYSFGDRF